MLKYLGRPYKRRHIKESDIIEILSDTTSLHKDIATRYKLSRGYISCLFAGKAWKELSLNPEINKRLNCKRKLDSSVVKLIRSGYDVDYKQLAKEHNVSVKWLYRLRSPSYVDSYKTIRHSMFIKTKSTHPKITSGQLSYIRGNKTASHAELARKFNVTKQYISYIRRNLRKVNSKNKK